MRKTLQNHLLIIIGWICILLAVIGVVLPLFPTTPFLILALVFFSKSSTRFHQMLLNNVWFGPILKQWEENKTLSRSIKYKVTLLIIVTFLISITIFHKMILIQLLLVTLAIVLLFFIWRIKEAPVVSKSLDND